LQGVNDLTVAEKVLTDIRSGSLGKVLPAKEQELLGIAREIDATKEAIRVARERSDERQKDYAAAAEGARAAKQAESDRLRALTSGTATEVFKRQQADIEFLRQAFYDGKIAVEQYGEAVSIVIGAAAIETEKAKSVAEELGMTFASAFEDAVIEGQKFGDVLKALEKDILRIVTRKLVTEPLANAIGGAISGSGGFGGLLTSLIGGVAGGKAIGGQTMPNSIYQIAENRPEVYSDGSRSWLITGSQRGNVDANPRMSGGRTINAPIYITVPGNTNRQTAEQIGAEVSRALSVSNARNN
jgi:hypothetical protein